MAANKLTEQKVFGIATIGDQLLYFDPETSLTRNTKLASHIFQQYNKTFRDNQTANHPTCTGRHTLKEFGVYNDSFMCDGCRNRASLNDTLFGCRICNYDLCQWCYNGNTAVGTRDNYKIAIPSLKGTVYCNTKENNVTIGFLICPSVGYKYTFDKSIIQNVLCQIHKDLDSIIQTQTNMMDNHKIPLYILQIQCHNIFRKRIKRIHKAMSKAKRTHYCNQCCQYTKNCCVKLGKCMLPIVKWIGIIILGVLFVVSLCWVPYLCYKAISGELWACCGGSIDQRNRSIDLRMQVCTYNTRNTSPMMVDDILQLAHNQQFLERVADTGRAEIELPRSRVNLFNRHVPMQIIEDKTQTIVEEKAIIIEQKDSAVAVAPKMKNLMTNIKDKFAAWRAARKLVDNVFTDLENLFYLLSELMYRCEFKAFSDDIKVYMVIIIDFSLIFINLIIYSLISLVSICVVLPSCFFLLIARINKVETDTVQLEQRAEQLKQDTNLQKCCRLFHQFVRALFMFGFLVIYPIIIIYGIIPAFGNTDEIVITFIGSYLFIIVALQIFGTYRGLKSFQKRKALKPLNKKYVKQKWKWNIGSLIGLILVIYEVFQLSVYAFHIIGQQNENDTDSTKWTADGMINSGKLTKFANKLISICYLSIDFVDEYILEFYALFSIIFVGILLVFFTMRFIYELKTYAKLKYKDKNEIKAREFYFYSFLGAIIYGHGNLKGVNKWCSKLVALLSDTLFLPICQKVILILSCTSPINSSDGKTSYLRIDPSNNTVCWDSTHKLYATIALILLGYYIPISAMIAPILAQEDVENDEETAEEEPKSKWKQFFSFDNTIQIVAPFMSALTVTECFMLVTSVFISRGGAIGTIISQSICMICLSIFTLNWSLNNLHLYGLNQNEPVFPWGISMIRCLGFFCGFIGCIIEIFRYNSLIDDALDLFLLFMSIVVISVAVSVMFWKYYNIFSKFNNDNVDSNLMVIYDETQNLLSINVDKLENKNVDE